DVSAVLGDAVLVGQPGGELGRAHVHGLGVPAARILDVALVLDADGLVVEAAVVPGDVGVVDHLRDLAVGRAHHVVGRDVGVGVLEPRDAAGVGALHRVDDDVVDLPGAAAGVAVVAAVGRVPQRAGVADAERQLANAVLARALGGAGRAHHRQAA